MTRGLAAAGRAAGRAGVRAASAVANAYRAVDPDVRRHVAELPLLGVTLLAGAKAGRVARLPDDGARAIVFVHGLGGHPGNFGPMRAWLWLHGRRRTYAIGLDEGRPVADLAKALGAFLDRVRRVNRLAASARFDLVAHSMGGLVARALLLDRAQAARVATLVTLGTPHAGSHPARWAATPAMLDLRPDSALLGRLRRQLPWRGPPSQPRLVCLWSRGDVLVLPAESALVEGATNVEVKGLSHYGYLLRPSAWREIAAALRDP